MKEAFDDQETEKQGDWVMRLTLKFKLGVAFAVILTMAAISGFMGIQALQTMDERLGTIVNREVVLTRFANDIIRNQLRTQRTLGYLALSSDAVERRQHEAAIDELRVMIDEGIDQAYAMSAEGGRALLDEIRQDIAAMRTVNGRVIELARLNRTNAAGALLSGDGAAAATKVAVGFDALLERYEGRMVQSSMEASELYAFNRNLLIMLLAGMIVIAVVAATWVVLNITRGVASSVSLAQAVASGDLNATAQVKSNDEIKDLVDALNAMAAKLREVVGEVTGAVRNVASGSQEMAATSEQLSQGATEQAAS
ncbi:MCP four helix bundle domain-containing protein, partial [Billgrantia sp. Q4P2]|uniref:MCP four helix bundle domain-containing protein n=1 Tax=Billgrantia sp. Q4P2 TaxID=3463857 RepID=UPI00405722A0